MMSSWCKAAAPQGPQTALSRAPGTATPLSPSSSYPNSGCAEGVSQCACARIEKTVSDTMRLMCGSSDRRYCGLAALHETERVVVSLVDPHPLLTPWAVRPPIKRSAMLPAILSVISIKSCVLSPCITHSSCRNRRSGPAAGGRDTAEAQPEAAACSNAAS